MKVERFVPLEDPGEACRTSAKSVAVNVKSARNSICIQRRRKLVYFVIGFVRFIFLESTLSIIRTDSRSGPSRARGRMKRAGKRRGR